MTLAFPRLDEFAFGQILIGRGAEGLEELDPEERQAVSPRAVPKRLAEFIAGRRAAKLALRRLHGTDVDAKILRDETGAPSVRAPALPPTFVSISHHAELAIAVASPWRVGIDLVGFAELSAAFRAEAFDPFELRAWGRSLGRAAEDPRVVNLAFGVKEAVLKWLRLGFRIPLLSIANEPVEGPHGGPWTIRVHGCDGNAPSRLRVHAVQSEQAAAVWVHGHSPFG